jgi:pSer/pThr/pTyr-binding forkhead associated (FHA) protein
MTIPRRRAFPTMAFELARIAQKSAGRECLLRRYDHISVIPASSNSLMRQLTKAKTSIERTGGGADIEIHDSQISPLHCVVGVANDIVRLCDLDSLSGTYANEERVQAAELDHLSEFPLGSTWLVVTIVPKHFMVSTSF